MGILEQKLLNISTELAKSRAASFQEKKQLELKITEKDEFAKSLQTAIANKNESSRQEVEKT